MMKLRIFILFAVFLLAGCKKKADETASPQWNVVSERFSYKENDREIQLNIDGFKNVFSKQELPLKKIVVLNASLLGYVSELHLEDKISGVSSPEYIYSETILDKIKNGQTEDVGNEQKYDVERILKMKPDVVFSNYVESFENTYELLRKNGIKIIFINEYLEEDPLKKSAYLLLFGKLLGKEKEAETVYREISENYSRFKQKASSAKEKPVVLANEMYGNIWYLPGGKSNIARFLADANADYINKENSDSKAVSMTFEEVYSKSANASFWVNVGNHFSKPELLTSNPNYGKLNAFKSGKIYTVSGREKGKANDYFQSGVVRADLVLRDYIKIFHPELFADAPLVYMKELK